MRILIFFCTLFSVTFISAASPRDDFAKFFYYDNQNGYLFVSVDVTSRTQLEAKIRLRNPKNPRKEVLFYGRTIGKVTSRGSRKLQKVKFRSDEGVTMRGVISKETVLGESGGARIEIFEGRISDPSLLKQRSVKFSLESATPIVY